VKQEVGTGPHPPPPVETQRTARDQTVQVEVVPQGLIPGMEDGQKSDSAVQVGASEIREGFGSRFKEDGDQDLWVRQEQDVEFVRDREDQMEVSGGKQFLLVMLKPAVSG